MRKVALVVFLAWVYREVRNKSIEAAIASKVIELTK